MDLKEFVMELAPRTTKAVIEAEAEAVAVIEAAAVAQAEADAGAVIEAWNWLSG